VDECIVEPGRNTWRDPLKGGANSNRKCLFCTTNLGALSFPFRTSPTHDYQGSGTAQDLFRLAQPKNSFQNNRCLPAALADAPILCTASATARDDLPVISYAR